MAVRLWFLLLSLFSWILPATATNASYIALSNQMARTMELNVVANNVANTNTPGYEMDSVILSNAKAPLLRQKKDVSFVYPEGAYNSADQGPIKLTGAPLDVAIDGRGYFKILTPAGPRYTLDGHMIPNKDGVLVNVHGMPYSNREGQPIILPENYSMIDIVGDGTVYVDREDVGQIGVFDFPSKYALMREGSNIYYSKVADIAVEEVKIVRGAIRESNVNSARAMADMVTLQRAVSFNNSLMSDLISLEKSAISRMAKQ